MEHTGVVDDGSYKVRRHDEHARGTVVGVTRVHAVVASLGRRCPPRPAVLRPRRPRPITETAPSARLRAPAAGRPGARTALAPRLGARARGPPSSARPSPRARRPPTPARHGRADAPLPVSRPGGPTTRRRVGVPVARPRLLLHDAEPGPPRPVRAKGRGPRDGGRGPPRGLGRSTARVATEAAQVPRGRPGVENVVGPLSIRACGGRTRRTRRRRGIPSAQSSLVEVNCLFF